MADPRTLALANNLVVACQDAGLTLATAESCTGGMVAAALTDIGGASAVFDRGFVTYSNAAKSDLLDVPAHLIETRGAVSGEVAAAMALGCIARSHADLGVAVTGIAGPGGGTAEKPVGLVHLAVARRGANEAQVIAERRLELGAAFERAGRGGVREETVRAALQLMLAAVRVP